MKPKEIVPLPLFVDVLGGPALRLDERIDIRVSDANCQPVAEVLASIAGGGAIRLELSDDPSLPAGEEAYRLLVTAEEAALTARTPVGLARAAAAFVQLIDGEMAQVPAVLIEDAPRFPWRGLSLDVARSFFPVSEIEVVIDLLFRYRFNTLHLHLTDDQGWRLEIPSRPRLTEISGRTAVKGGRSGHYSLKDLERIASYARARGIRIVLEIDVPGHTNAATHAYGDLNPSGAPTEAYDGIEVGFSRLHADLPATEAFLADVYGAAAELTEGDYVHIGGDEALEMGLTEYLRLVEAAAGAVHRAGKRIIGWQEIAGADLEPGSVIQFWDPRRDASPLVEAASRGALLLMSPADRVYLDMKYDAATMPGQDWAGYVTLRDSYDWEPLAQIPDVLPDSIVGIEAGMWTEAVHSLDELTYMLLPRLAAVGEVAWTAAEHRDWEGFKSRIEAESQWWSEQGLAWRGDAAGW